MPNLTTPTDDVNPQLGDSHVVSHTPECDRQSYGDACIGGCTISDTP